jgi:hypothetical protein
VHCEANSSKTSETNCIDPNSESTHQSHGRVPNALLLDEADAAEEYRDHGHFRKWRHEALSAVLGKLC